MTDQPELIIDDRSLDMDAPEPWPVQGPEAGPVQKVPEVGGLHHHGERMAT
jgi:hypothetical protein